MNEMILGAIFGVHAAAFAWFYLRRGRKLFNLLFLAGFVLLAVSHASHGWLSSDAAGSLSSQLNWLRWIGLALCGLATPPFLIHGIRKLRTG